MSVNNQLPPEFELRPYLWDVDFGHFIQQLPSGLSFTIVSDSCHSGGLIDKSKEQIGPHSTLRAIPSLSVDYRTRGISIETLYQSLQTAANVMSTTSSFLDKTAVANARMRESEILLSGCQANEFSIDMRASDKTRGKVFGAFTYTVLKVIKESNGASSNRQLVVKARNEIINLGIGKQHPCLYCSDENVDAGFLGYHPNSQHQYEYVSYQLSIRVIDR
ncbi:metacaspase-9-like [Gossypium arboreum]|uniref:metacaspase-9-like n=1 Tax=Gossypium arboreum TaxID=29729 RepID=UPI0022F1A848|nr:metacaspase-9-like [Gossypium arboreum]